MLLVDAIKITEAWPLLDSLIRPFMDVSHMVRIEKLI
jgi:hypothetical protein